MGDFYSEMVDRAECEFCDDNGIRLNQLGRCDHIDYGAIAKRGIEKVRRALEGN